MSNVQESSVVKKSTPLTKATQNKASTKIVLEKTTQKKSAAKKTVTKKPATKKTSKSCNPTKPCIMITGSNGSLAQKTIERLKADYTIIAVDFRAAPLLGKDIHSYKVNFNKREFEQLFRDYDVESVIHLGRISANQLHRNGRYAANVLGTKKLLDLCVKYDVKNVTVLSTYHVYGAHPYNPAMLDEDAPLKGSGLTMDLLDSVELENLCNVYLWKHPELNLKTLRPCNIVGPGIQNTIGRLLKLRRAPVLIGFSPIMQFIHIEDMATAIIAAFEKGTRGVYNISPDDWVSYKSALKAAGCKIRPILSVPESLSRQRVKLLGKSSFPNFLYNYFKYSVIIDGSHFSRTFDFKPKYSLAEIFEHYKALKNKS